MDRKTILPNIPLHRTLSLIMECKECKTHTSNDCGHCHEHCQRYKCSKCNEYIHSHMPHDCRPCKGCGSYTRKWSIHERCYKCSFPVS